MLFRSRKDNPEKVAAQYRRYAKLHPEKLRERALRHRHKNIEAVRVRDRVAAAKQREVKPELIKQRKRAYQRTHSAVINAAVARRDAAKLKRTPKWVGAEEFWLIKEAYDLAALRTKMFGFQWHVDHVIPLQGKNVSGLHVPTNLQVIPAVENIRKKNSFVVV